MWNVAKTDQSRSMRKVVKQLDLPLRVLIVLAPKTIERLLKKIEDYIFQVWILRPI